MGHNYFTANLFHIGYVKDPFACEMICSFQNFSSMLRDILRNTVSLTSAYKPFSTVTLSLSLFLYIVVTQSFAIEKKMRLLCKIRSDIEGLATLLTQCFS